MRYSTNIETFCVQKVIIKILQTKETREWVANILEDIYLKSLVQPYYRWYHCFLYQKYILDWTTTSLLSLKIKNFQVTTLVYFGHLNILMDNCYKHYNFLK